MVARTKAAVYIIGRLAAELQQLSQQRPDIKVEIMLVVDAHPRLCVLASMPYIKVGSATGSPHRSCRQRL